MKAVGYIRVSTEEQHLSPEAQRSAIERWCKDGEHTLIAVYSDIGVSGDAPVEDRTGLCTALGELEAGTAQGLVVLHRDRLARNVMVAAMASHIAEAAGARIYSVSGNNGDSPEDQLMRTIVDAFAQYERTRIRLRTKMAMATKRARGERISGVPYGYTFKEPGGPPVVDDLEMAVVKMIKKLHGRGISVRDIARELNKRQIPPRKGALWQKTFVHMIVQRFKEEEKASGETSGSGSADQSGEPVREDDVVREGA